MREFLQTATRGLFSRAWVPRLLRGVMMSCLQSALNLLRRKAVCVQSQDILHTLCKTEPSFFLFHTYNTAPLARLRYKRERRSSVTFADFLLNVLNSLYANQPSLPQLFVLSWHLWQSQESKEEMQRDKTKPPSTHPTVTSSQKVASEIPQENHKK